MVLKLHTFPFSTCGRRVAVVLKELNVPFELVPIDMMKGEHKSPAFMKMQPFGQVPVLEDDGFFIYESRAIARYLAIKYKSDLLPNPSDPKAYGLFEQAASVEIANFDPGASGITGEVVFQPMRGNKTDEARVAHLKQSWTEILKVYDTILSKQKYLAGDKLTLADLFHLPYGHMVTNAVNFKMLEDPSLPNVARWWADITSRPTWQSVKDIIPPQ